MESTQASDLLAKSKDIANSEKTEKKILQVKGSVHGAVTGLVVGLMVGYYKNYNLYLSAIAGVVVGGAISHFLLKESSVKKDVKKVS